MQMSERSNPATHWNETTKIKLNAASQPMWIRPNFSLNIGHTEHKTEGSLKNYNHNKTDKSYDWHM